MSRPETVNDAVSAKDAKDAKDTRLVDADVPGQMNPIEGREKDQKKNYAGGFTFEVSLKDRIRRIAILGTDKNTYYATAKELTTEALQYVTEQVAAGKGAEIIAELDTIYSKSLAPKLQYMIVLHAMLCRCPDLAVRKKAMELLAKYRTMSHIYTWKGAHKSAGKSKGFGRLVRRTLANKFLGMDPMQLAYQVTKYQQRKVGDQSWSFSDFMSCVHLKTGSGDNREKKVKSPEEAAKNAETATEMDVILRYAKSGWDSAKQLAESSKVLNAETSKVFQYLKAINEVKALDEKSVDRICTLIWQHRLTREQLPTAVLSNVQVLRAMLTDATQKRITMPMTALIRNLGSITAKGVFAGDEGKKILALVCDHITNVETLKRARVHPVQALIAYQIYKQGTGVKGSLVWAPEELLTKALEAAFYSSFKTIKPTNKRVLHCLDCSASMTDKIPALPYLSSAEAIATMAMMFARAEQNQEKPTVQHDFVVFTAGRSEEKHGQFFDVERQTWSYGPYVVLGAGGLFPVKITADMSLKDAMDVTKRSDWGMTDCTLPISDALKNKKEYDAFIVYTDNQCQAGAKHPSEALREYRNTMNIPAKLVVVSTLATNSTIADPKDSGMMDVCGFDPVGPELVTDFIRGKPDDNIENMDKIVVTDEVDAADAADAVDE